MLKRLYLVKLSPKFINLFAFNLFAFGDSKPFPLREGEAALSFKLQSGD